MSKGLQALGKITGTQNLTMYEQNECLIIIEKELKALEIIKAKRVNVNCIMSGWLLGKYNSYKTHISLTQEEYDLLKGVLL